MGSMPSVALIPVITAVSTAGSGLTAGKLWISGLARKYRILFAYFIFRVIYGLLSFFLDANSAVYMYFFFATQVVAWFFYVALIVELFGLVFARHQGLYTVGRWAVYIGVPISVGISIAALIPKITPEMPQASAWGIGLVLAVERGLDFGLAIFLILMMLLLNVYTVPLSRNVVVHAVIYTVFFLSGSLAVIVRSVFGLKHADVSDAAILAVSCTCVFCWLFLLSAKGERTRVRLPWYSPEQEERILSHLDSLNAALLKTAQR